LIAKATTLVSLRPLFTAVQLTPQLVLTKTPPLDVPAKSVLEGPPD
jgi:hypothetical protein